MELTRLEGHLEETDLFKVEDLSELYPSIDEDHNEVDPSIEEVLS